ncbi:hypothetical protein [Nocardioides conyzicola]|uniref:GerMN domain-containing protein n=1 Tax=Nocardioides conyzicola TaxID=1651781 RepID=A0ABP8XFU4_9ACTN
MGIVGGRRGHARPHATAAIVLVAALLASILAGCAEPVDESRTVQTHIGRLHHVIDVDVATPTPDRSAAITVTYAGDVETPAALSALVTAIGAVAADLDYPAYLLTLVPALDPKSALTVDPGFAARRDETDVLSTWLSLTEALLGTVGYDVRADGETISVGSAGATAHDIAEVRRIGHGTAATTWVFRAGEATFTASARVRASDVALFQAVQRNAGAEGQPVWARSWQLDRRQDHVRLDLDLVIGSASVPAAQLTVARYGRTLAPLAHTSLTALAATRTSAWLTLHHGHDAFASWASDQPAAAGRDPLDRGWDVWLGRQAASARR